MLRGRELWTSTPILKATPSPRSWCRPPSNPSFSHFTQEEDIICCHNGNAGIFVSLHAYFQSYDPNTFSFAQTKVGSAWDSHQYWRVFTSWHFYYTKSAFTSWHFYYKKENAGNSVSRKSIQSSKMNDYPNAHLWICHLIIHLFCFLITNINTFKQNENSASLVFFLL